MRFILMMLFFLPFPLQAQEIQNIPDQQDQNFVFPICSTGWTPPAGVVLRAAGTTKEGTKMMFFKSDSGKWGLLEVNLDGMMCLLATGTDWLERPDK